MYSHFQFVRQWTDSLQHGRPVCRSRRLSWLCWTVTSLQQWLINHTGGQFSAQGHITAQKLTRKVWTVHCQIQPPSYWAMSDSVFHQNYSSVFLIRLCDLYILETDYVVVEKNVNDVWCLELTNLLWSLIINITIVWHGIVFFLQTVSKAELRSTNAITIFRIFFLVRNSNW